MRRLMMKKRLSTALAKVLVVFSILFLPLLASAQQHFLETGIEIVPDSEGITASDGISINSSNSFLRQLRYPAEERTWVQMIDATAYFRDVLAGGQTYISGATDGETWTANATLPDGSTVNWNVITFYRNYGNSSNCFVSPNFGALCGSTSITVIWYLTVQCQQLGSWLINFYNNDNFLFSTQFALLPQIHPNRVPLYNQGAYNDRDNPDHAYDNICRTQTDSGALLRDVFPCDGRPSEVPWTIAGKGCYLSSGAMILGYHGVNVDPPALNAWLNENNGYTETGDVYPSAIVEYAQTRGIDMTYPAPEPDPENVWTELERLERYICYYGPHMVGVRVNQNGRPGHWVAATGKNEARTTYLINDPNGGDATTLAQRYNNTFSGIRAFGGPEYAYTDRTGIDIRFHSPGELLLTDPQGRRIGYDPVQGITYNEIPDAYYEVSRLDDDETGELGPESKELYVPQPPAGDYHLQVIGTGTGTYTLEMRATDPALKSSIDKFKDIPITPDTVHTYGFYYAKTAGSEIEFNPVPGNFDGKGQRPRDVNRFLSYVSPTESRTTLPAGATIASLVVLYDKNIIPATFGATLNGIDITSFFHPVPGGAESVSVQLVSGRNTLVLSVEGHLPSRIARDTDRLVFIVP